MRQVQQVVVLHQAHQRCAPAGGVVVVVVVLVVGVVVGVVVARLVWWPRPHLEAGLLRCSLRLLYHRSNDRFTSWKALSRTTRRSASLARWWRMCLSKRRRRMCL